MPTDGADALNLLRRAAGPADRRGTACRADQGGVRRVARLRLSSRDRRAAWRRPYREPQEGHAADERKRPDRGGGGSLQRPTVTTTGRSSRTAPRTLYRRTSTSSGSPI